jgi:hypothetical protein
MGWEYPEVEAVEDTNSKVYLEYTLERLYGMKVLKNEPAYFLSDWEAISVDECQSDPLPRRLPEDKKPKKWWREIEFNKKHKKKR